MELAEIVEKITEVFKQIGEMFKEWINSFHKHKSPDISSTVKESKEAALQITSQKRYNRSLAAHRRNKNKEHIFYKNERKVQKHLPYQRRNY